MNYLRLNFLNIQQISFNLKPAIYGIVMAKPQIEPLDIAVISDNFSLDEVISDNFSLDEVISDNFSLDEIISDNFSLDESRKRKLEEVRWGSPLSVASVASVNQQFGRPSKIVDTSQSLFDKNLQGLNPISKEEKKIMNDARQAHNSIFFNPDHSKDHPKVYQYVKEINRFVDNIRNNGHINPAYPEDMFQILLGKLRILAFFCEDDSLDTFNTACNYFQEIFEIVKKAFSLVNDEQLRIKDISERIIFIIEQANSILVIKGEVNDKREERAAQNMLSYILTWGERLLSSLVSIECRMNISFETDINNGILLSEYLETDSSTVLPLSDSGTVLPLSEYPRTDLDDDFLSSESEDLEEFISNIFCFKDDGISSKSNDKSLTVVNSSRCQNPERREKIERYHRKRKRRNWKKGPRYKPRAKLACSRPRKKGRFVAKKD